MEKKARVEKKHEFHGFIYKSFIHSFIHSMELKVSEFRNGSWGRWFPPVGEQINSFTSMRRVLVRSFVRFSEGGRRPWGPFWD